MKTLIVISVLLLAVFPACCRQQEFDRRVMCSQAADRYNKEVIDPLLRAGVPVGSIDSVYNIRLNTCLFEHAESYSDGSFVFVDDILRRKPIALCRSAGGNDSWVEGYTSLSYNACINGVKRLMHSETWWQWWRQQW